MLKAVRFFRIQGRDIHSGERCDDIPKGYVSGLLASGFVAELPDPDGPVSIWPASLSPKAIAGLESKRITPEGVAELTDEQLGDVPGVGPASVRVLRDAFGGPVAAEDDSSSDEPGGGEPDVDDAPDADAEQ